MAPIYRFGNGVDLSLRSPWCGLPEDPGLHLISISGGVSGLLAALLMRSCRTTTILHERHEWTEDAPARWMIILKVACLIRRNAADMVERRGKNRRID